MQLSTFLPYAVLHPFSVLPIPNFLRPSRLGPKRSLVLGLTLGFSLSLSLTGLTLYALDAWRRSLRRKAAKRIIEVRGDEVVDGIEGLIGNTPLVRINSLSDALGVEILGKCEYMNPFGSVKDRVSLQIIKQAEEEGLIHPNTGSCIFEGTSGSTGISIAGIARARGYKAHIVLPDDVAAEKIQMLRVLGAEVEPVRPVSIVDRRHYVNLARQRALEFGRSTVRSTTSASTPSATPRAVTPLPMSDDAHTAPDLLVTSGPEPSASENGGAGGDSSAGGGEGYRDPPRGLFADQFENLSNLRAHAEGTAQEVWAQTAGRVDGFVSGAGTGGTIAGVGRVLKEKTGGACEVVLADPQGSGLFHKIHDGVMYAETEAEGKRRRYQVDTIVEGIGLNRITRNLSQALPIIDDAIRVTDAEAVAMSRHLALSDGLFLGSSSAVNLVACVRLARAWGHKGRGRRIVTILCDSGARHASRFWNDDYLARAGIPLSSSIDFLFTEPPLRALEEGDDAPDPTHDTELASDDPSEMPPLSPALVADTPEEAARFAPA
ncbi:Cysteine synthase 2 [Rhodotorula kratochvilovae]